VWRKLRKQIGVEREMLHAHLADYSPLLRKCALCEPDRVEMSALGAMLQGFYAGAENIFKRIRIELNEGLPTGEVCHKALLDSMTVPGPGRPAVLSAPLAQTLEEYLKFRHVFRGAYLFQLRWDRMSKLALNCNDVLDRLEGELDTFLKATEDKE
jgi:hypothetical protein